MKNGHQFKDEQTPADQSHALWWLMLQKRTLDLAHILPSSLSGNIQFEVERATGEKLCFHLMLRGPRTRGSNGSVTPVDALVRTTNEKLHALLFAEKPPTDALVVSGNAGLFQSFLRFLSAKPAPRSMLQLRGES